MSVGSEIGRFCPAGGGVSMGEGSRGGGASLGRSRTGAAALAHQRNYFVEYKISRAVAVPAEFN
jgi:hypothetical protein